MRTVFFMKESRTLRRWELALLLGVAAAALLGVWLNRSQAELADRVIRLHVLANSDTQADQALKLEVRDRVLEEAARYFDPEATLEQTRATLTSHLADLAEAGAEQVAAAGYRYPVTVSLEENCWFPTKQYTDFALPAGEYTALRVVIGTGEGQNWWCVMFPPLCLGSVSETAAQTSLSDGFTSDQISLITGEDQGYVVKFKAIELWEEFQHWLSGT